MSSVRPQNISMRKFSLGTAVTVWSHESVWLFVFEMVSVAV